MVIGPKIRLMPDPAASPEAPPLRLGFVRGVAPSKWARRWRQAGGGPLELVPLPVSGPWPAGLDVVLERVAPGERPAGTEGPEAARHAVRLYEEAVALVTPREHELADEGRVDLTALALVPLLAHPDHASAWPAAQPWDDPRWAPVDATATLELVAAGTGTALLSLPLARHLAGKRQHAVLPVVGRTASGDAPFPGTEIWASWAVARDGADVQQLIGILRGRTARSGRPGAGEPDPEPTDPSTSAATTQQAPRKPTKQLPKNSRGAQLATARAKQERERAAKRAQASTQAKRGKRRGR